MVKVRKPLSHEIADIEALLRHAQLSIEDLASGSAHFFVAETAGRIVGVGGYDDCGEGVGFLRSFAVDPGYRNQGIARKLYDEIMEECCRSGLLSLYLLTITAQHYFSRLGFAPLDRAKAPPPIQHTHQFGHSCPTSAVLMYRSLAAECGGRASAPRAPHGSGEQEP